jgi:hypothetical protein
MSARTDPMGAGTEARPRKIAILGFAETVHDAPFSDPSWEIWGMNGVHRILTKVPEERFSLWFEIHTLAYLEWHGPASKIDRQQLDWLEKPHPFPILHHEERADWPSSKRLPIEQCVELGRDYFTSTVAYELAFVLWQREIGDREIDEVGIWGIDLVHGTEWAEQRPCAEYWIGKLEGPDSRSPLTKITIHPRSALLKTPFRYGHDEVDPVWLDTMHLLDEVDRQVTEGTKKIQLEIDQLTRKMHANDGAHQAATVIREQLAKWPRGGRIR